MTHIISYLQFGWATGLIMNLLKSTILYGSCDMHDIAYIQRIFRVGADSLEVGMKYLGYRIKPCKYKNNDWLWLVECFYKEIMGWEFRWLLLGGHITLTQSVLTQLGVYRAHLYHLPRLIINSLHRIMAQYILFGAAQNFKYHLVKLENITIPKKLGGWGVLNLRQFGWALCWSHCGVVYLERAYGVKWLYINI